MLQCFFIRVLGMAGEDILETFDTDDEISSLASSNADSSEEQTVPKLADLPPYHMGRLVQESHRLRRPRSRY